MPASFFVSLFPLSFVVVGAIIAITIAVNRNPTFQYQNSYSRSDEKSKSIRSKSQRKQFKQIKNSCQICESEIKDRDNDMTKLPCDHEFHEKCFKSYFNRTKNDRNMVKCPVPSHEKEELYSLSY